MTSPVTIGLTRFARLQRNVYKGKPYILVACMQKSGSTFLTNMVAELSGYRKYPLVYKYQQNEQDVYLPRLIDAYWFGTVTQQHVRATAPNLELLELYGIQPTILVRNIFDIVVSMRDHLYRESLKNPIFYLNEEFYTYDKATQFDLIITMGLPWYFSFFASWWDACSRGGIEGLWLTYEDVIADKVAALRKIMDFYEIPKTDAELKTAVENTTRRSDNRVNKGVSGRGSAELTEAQKEQIGALTRFYPWVDFSRIGIKNNQQPTISNELS